jgi:hypothetical protein
MQGHQDPDDTIGLLGLLQVNGLKVSQYLKDWFRNI